MANTLALTGASFDTTGQRFGTAAMAGGFGIAPGGLISGFPVTWECRFKRSSAPGSLEVIMGQSGLGWFGMTTSGKIQFELGNNPPTDLYASNSVADGAWHHAAIAATATSFLAFLDGALIGSASVSAGSASFAVSGTIPSANGYMGVNNHGGSQQFQFGGEVDEAAVWSTNRYTAAFTPPSSAYTGNEPSLLALWHLDGNGADSTGANPAATISAPSIAGLTVGGSTTVSGTFANGAPSALSQVLDGVTTSVSGGTITTTSGSAATASGTYSYTIGTPGTGAHALQVLGTGAYSASSGTTNFQTSSAPPVTVLPSNAAIAYSPYNWSGGKTINPGAYLRMAFTGASIAFNFDMSAQLTPCAELWIGIDGQPPQSFTMASTITPAMPSLTAGWPKHIVELVVKSTSEFQSRWNPQASAVILTSILLANGASASTPSVPSRNVLCFGDSITEAYQSVQIAGSNSTNNDGSDAALGWAYCLRNWLGANVGVVGFGGTGLLNPGQGGVPAIGASYNLLWSGQSRTFSPTPALIVINEGENDKTAPAATFQSAFQAFLSALLTSVPACPVAVLRPFSGVQAEAIQAALLAIGSPRLHYIDTTGLFDTTLSVDGQHPLGVANLATIGPKIAGLVTPLLSAAANRWSHA